jgi:6-phospho-beta-glucosidase
VKLAILGGGGFRVPLVYEAVLSDASPDRVTHVALYDADPRRLEAIGHVVRGMAASHEEPASLEVTPDLDTALADADFVFSAVRVGGLAGRTADERVALDLGLLGQETTGPGGVSFGLRTVPVAVHIAERVAAVAPHAWVINFTNPAGMVTEAMQQVLGERVIGICDSPIGLGRRAARALGHDPATTSFDYVGLNHLGWLQQLGHEGRDVLPDLLADPARLLRTEEGRLFGPEWLQSIGAIPNEYLYYYYFTRDAVAAIKGDAQTRGEFLLEQQTAFYDAVAREPGGAVDLWRRVRAERDATYMKESRDDDEERDAADVEGGGYEGVALDIMAAIRHDRPARMILNVRNGAAVPGLPPEAVVEVLCDVDARGPRPVGPPSLAGGQLGLVQQVKAVEQLAIRAARTRSPRLAVQALALHPLVDSVTTARLLFRGYQDRIPALAQVFDPR